MNWWQVGFSILAVANLGLFWLLWRIVYNPSEGMGPETEASLRRFIAYMESERRWFRDLDARDPFPPLLQEGDVQRVYLNPEANGYVHGYLRMEPAGKDKDEWKRVFAGQGPRRD